MLSKAKSLPDRWQAGRYLSGKKVICLIFMLIFVSTLTNGFPIDIEKLYEGEYDIFYASSFDPDNPGAQPLVFIFQITNNDTIPRGCKLSLSFSSNQYPDMLTQDEGTIKNYIQLGSTTDDSLRLAAGQSITISNRDVINSDVHIEGSWDDILDKNEDFKNLVLDTGSLPADTYYFTLIAFNPNSPFPTEDNIYSELLASVDVVNPSGVTPISPGEPFTNAPPEIVGNLPIFSWFANISQFNLEIFEVESGEVPDDIVNKDPYFAQEQIVSNIFPYPDYAPELVSNQTYAWRVIGIVQTTQGQVLVESVLWCFVISSNQVPDPEIQNITYFVENLENLGILDLGNLNIGNFTPTGEVYLNGNLIPVEDLIELLNNILNGSSEILKIEIE